VLGLARAASDTAGPARRVGRAADPRDRDDGRPGVQLAVELHRYGPADPTFNFDLELTGYTATALPRLEIVREENSVTLRWPEWSAGYDLEASSSLNAGTGETGPTIASTCSNA